MYDTVNASTHDQLELLCIDSIHNIYDIYQLRIKLRLWDVLYVL